MSGYAGPVFDGPLAGQRVLRHAPWFTVSTLTAPGPGWLVEPEPDAAPAPAGTVVVHEYRWGKCARPPTPAEEAAFPGLRTVVLDGWVLWQTEAVP